MAEYIKAEDLRIGNLVTNKEKQSLKLASVNHLGVQAIVCSDDHFTYLSYQELQFLEPIPLTEGWLSEHGFNYHDIDGDGGFWQILPFQILHGEDGFSYDYHYEIKWVHQLQNLYHALTGQELTIKQTA